MVPESTDSEVFETIDGVGFTLYRVDAGISG